MVVVVVSLTSSGGVVWARDEEEEEEKFAIDSRADKRETFESFMLQILSETRTLGAAGQE